MDPPPTSPTVISHYCYHLKLRMQCNVQRGCRCSHYEVVSNATALMPVPPTTASKNDHNVETASYMMAASVLDRCRLPDKLAAGQSVCFCAAFNLSDKDKGIHSALDVKQYMKAMPTINKHPRNISAYSVVSH